MFSKLEREQDEVKMYGQTEQEVLDAFYAATMYSPKHIYIMGILSDAQEASLRGDTRSVRQFINKAKLLIAYTTLNENK